MENVQTEKTLSNKIATILSYVPGLVFLFFGLIFVFVTVRYGFDPKHIASTVVVAAFFVYWIPSVRAKMQTLLPFLKGWGRSTIIWIVMFVAMIGLMGYKTPEQQAELERTASEREKVAEIKRKSEAAVKDENARKALEKAEKISAFAEMMEQYKALSAPNRPLKNPSPPPASAATI